MKISQEWELNDPEVNPDNGMTYGQWMDEVDEISQVTFGLGVRDFGDWLSHDCWAGGGSPGDGIETMLEANNW